MSNVFQIKPCAHLPTALRNIANSIEAGDLADSEATLIIGSEVYHLGRITDERAAESAVFNMVYGILKIMQPALGVANHD